MIGPFPPGTHRQLVPTVEPLWAGEFMKRGVWYRVTKTFTDADGDIHPPGEEWLFLGSSFSRYDELRTLFVATNTSEEWEIVLLYRPGTREIIDRIADFLTPVPHTGDSPSV